MSRRRLPRPHRSSQALETQASENDVPPPSYATVTAQDMMAGNAVNASGSPDNPCLNVSYCGEGRCCCPDRATWSRQQTVLEHIGSTAVLEQVCDGVMADFRNMLKDTVHQFTRIHGIYLALENADETGYVAAYRQVAAAARGKAETAQTSERPDASIHRLIASVYNTLADDFKAKDEVETYVEIRRLRELARSTLESTASDAINQRERVVNGDGERSADSRELNRLGSRPYDVPGVCDEATSAARADDQQGRGSNAAGRTTPSGSIEEHFAEEQVKAIAEANSVIDIALEARDSALKAHDKAQVPGPPPDDHGIVVVGAERREAIAEGFKQQITAEQMKDEAVRLRNRAVLDSITSDAAIEAVIGERAETPDFEDALRTVMRRLVKHKAYYDRWTTWDPNDPTGYGLAYRLVATEARYHLTKTVRDGKEPADLGFHYVTCLYDMLSGNCYAK